MRSNNIITILTLVVIILISYVCTREFSKEGREPNNLITTYSIHLTDQNVVKKIYLAANTKLHLGHWQILDSIKVFMQKDSVYAGSFDLKKYFPMERFIVGDVFYIMYEVRSLPANVEQINLDTLIY